MHYLFETRGSRRRKEACLESGRAVRSAPSDANGRASSCQACRAIEVPAAVILSWHRPSRACVQCVSSRPGLPGGGVTSRRAAPSHLERVGLHRPESFSGTGMVRSPAPVIAICRVVWSRARCARSSRRKVTPSVDVVVEWGEGCFLSQSARLERAFTRSTRTARHRRRARCGCRWST